MLLSCAQTENSRNEARRTIEDRTAKIDKTKGQLASHEEELAEAENVLEEIRDSLKGE